MNNFLLRSLESLSGTQIILVGIFCVLVFIAVLLIVDNLR